MSTIQPWQEEILKGFMQGREIKLMMAGRRVGKSMFSAQALKRLMDDIQNRPVEALVCDVQTVHGARYYTVSPDGGNWLDMETWCRATFGEPGEIWPKQDFCWPKAPRWMQNNRKFWFRNEKDRDWFVIKWNS